MNAKMSMTIITTRTVNGLPKKLSVKDSPSALTELIDIDNMNKTNSVNNPLFMLPILFNSGYAYVLYLKVPSSQKA